MRKIRKFLLGAVLIAVIAPATQTAEAFVVYTSRAAWEAALPGSPGFFYLEDFDDTTLVPGVGVSFGQVPVLGTPGSGTAIGTIDDGDNNLLIDRVGRCALCGTTMTTLTFSGPSAPLGIYAWGADFDVPYALEGLGLELWVNGSSVATIASSYVGFVGFVGSPVTDGFSTLEIRPGDTKEGFETFTLNDMVFAPVPLPAAAWLLLAGFAGFVGLGRRRGSAEAVAAA